MAATMTAAGTMNHNHVERVSPNEWEDEASTDEPGTGALANGQEHPRTGKNVRGALRSSFDALRPSSATGGPKASPSGRRERRESVMESLLHGLASAVGLHPRDSSPARDVSPGPDARFSRGGSKQRQPQHQHAGSHPHTLARLSSAAMMRSEIQGLGQFGDLRNDSFTSPSCSKLRRRSSQMLPRASDVSIIGLPPPSPVPYPAILTSGSGDLSRHSAAPGAPPPATLPIASSRLTCPGELPSPGTSPPGASQPYYSAAAVAATAAALATPPPREPPKPVPSPFHTPAAAPPPGDAPSGNAADAAGGGGGLRARRCSGGVPQLQAPLSVEIPSLPVPFSPHPPSQPPPQTRPSGSSLSPPASRSVSSEHLPPMTPSGNGGGLLSVRDRPPTPRGSRTSSSGSPPSTLAKVLSSFHLPDIITPSGRSGTERRGSVAGGTGSSFTRPADIGMPRSRRNSICSGPSVTGPGGAAISASLAKRAAAAAATAAAAVTSPGGGAGVGGGLPSPVAVAASGASWTGPMRASAPSGTARAGSVVGKPPGQHSTGGGILQDFQNSLELEEDQALAAVDAEFDRRFGQPQSEVPGAVDGGSPSGAAAPPPQQPQPQPPSQPRPPGPSASSQHPPAHTHTHLQPISLPQLPQSPQPHPHPHQLMPGEQLAPRAPASERTTPQNLARRAHGGAGGADGSGRSAGGGAAGSAASGGGGPPIFHAPRRMSCSATLTFDGGDDVCADQVMLASMDAAAAASFDRNSNKMRLASIRLSYAEGIVGGPAGVAIASGRASLDLPPAALARGPAASWGGAADPRVSLAAGAATAAPPSIGRHPAPPPAVAAAAAAGGAAL